jgi:hypothetical protein
MLSPSCIPNWISRDVHNRAISKACINFTPISRNTQYFRIAHGASLLKLQSAHRREERSQLQHRAATTASNDRRKYQVQRSADKLIAVAVWSVRSQFFTAYSKICIITPIVKSNTFVVSSTSSFSNGSPKILRGAIHFSAAAKFFPGAHIRQCNNAKFMGVTQQHHSNHVIRLNTAALHHVFR